MYIDPPLLKTEVTWRERNHLFHEESIKLEYKKTGSKPVFFLTSEDYYSRTGFVTEVSAHYIEDDANHFQSSATVFGETSKHNELF